MKTNYECTCYFRGIDGLGHCDTECQWWTEQGCPCAKGSVLWDGKEHNIKKRPKLADGVRGEKMKKKPEARKYGLSYSFDEGFADGILGNICLKPSVDKKEIIYRILKYILLIEWSKNLKEIKISIKAEKK